MTDQYGSGPHEDDVAGDHEHDHMAEAETWQGDQPPVDDFADHASEETATVSEETEIPSDTPIAETEVRKTSVTLPIIAGIGGLLILGAVLYWQFGSSNAASSTPPLGVTEMTKPPISTASATTAPSENADVAPTTNMAPVADATSSMPTTAAPSGVATPASAPAPIVTPAPVAALPPAAPAPAAVAATASAPAASTTASVPVPSTTPAVMPAVVSAPTPVETSAIDARLAALSSHIDDMQNALTQTVQQLNHVANMVAANQAPASVGPGIDDRLNKIEQQLAQLQHPVVAPLPVTATGESITPKATYKTKHASVSPKTNKKTSYASSHHMKKPTASTHWVLRAATPDEAWVAVSATAPALRHVMVGDDLPGVGRIRAIHQNGDMWVLEGTRGTIR
jgi:hypothetical protein